MPKIKAYGEGHIKRLKERFDAGAVSKQEILEILLSYVIKRKDVKPQAREIFQLSKGSFRRVFSVVENENIPGIGRETKVFFKAVKTFVNGFAEDAFLNEKIHVKNQKDIVEYFRALCEGADREAVYALYLDAKNKIIMNTKVSEGTLTQSVVYPREIMKTGIKCGALSVVLVHNHPSGDPAPSASDKRITKRLLFSLKEMDMTLLDHLVVGAGGSYFSFYDAGLIREYSAAYRDVEEEMVSK
jgi:DNA repair protein RadC